MPDPLLDDLTAAQKDAVTHINGPMLVVAGAGSGKTRVVTRRVAFLIRQGVVPWRIMALTFTNKAAGEMRTRVQQLVGDAPSWMGTFHSICARILRSDIHLLGDGRDNRYSIMDSGDQEGLVKQALKILNIDDKQNKPSAILSAISRAKSDGISPENFTPASHRQETAAVVYPEYEKLLRFNNALDFDDLLLLTARLLRTVPEAREKYQQRFAYLLVDEYQDTNHTQYTLLRELAGQTANLHATGDPDQSIYSWRGADYRNIMDFQHDYPGARIVRLEENYRSTQYILEAANHLIEHDPNRIPKRLYTSKDGGDRVTLARLQSDRMEAMWAAAKILELRRNGVPLGQTAVFYRTNAQSRPFEEAFMGQSVPYQLVGGIRFYERREIKDLLAHLKLRVNPSDLTSLRRVIDNRPGVGGRTLEKIAEAAQQAGMPVFTFLADPAFTSRYKATAKVAAFAKWCARLAAVDITRADTAVRDILACSELVDSAIAAAAKDELSEERIENLHSLAARAGEFVRQRLEAAAAEPEQTEPREEEIRSTTAIDLPAFLEDVALVADVDSWTGDADKVTIMTLHSAKGLEFDHVFIAGLEEGLLPHKNSYKEDAMAEERRLLYVGITRARKHAYLTCAASRFINGMFDFSTPSRFVDELPPDVLEDLEYDDPASPAPGSGFAPRTAPSPSRPKRKFRPQPTEDDPFVDDYPADFGDDDIFVDDMDFADEAVPGWKRTPKPAALKAPRFRPGDLVSHPQYGRGKVLTCDKNKVMVQFFSSGTRVLHLELTRLVKE